MGNTTEHADAVFYLTKINWLVADGREDLIAAIIADFERGVDACAADVAVNAGLTVGGVLTDPREAGPKHPGPTLA